MKKQLIFLLLFFSMADSYSQSFFSTNPYANSPRGAGATSIFGWGENFNRAIDVRPNPNADYGTMMINYHTGLTFSAHTVYGGIRFYNQGYPNAYDAASGSVMVMSVTNGSVGVGTTAPIGKLDVRGNLFVGTNDLSIGSTGSFVQIDQGAGSGNTFTQIRAFNNGGNSPTNLVLQNSGGYVGIGTTTPQEALSVNGNIRSKQVKVETTNWPDYVFKPKYDLPLLSELKAYVDQNHHLPELPSAEQVEKDGLNLGEMNRLLVKKVEELTLYLIEKDRQIKKQEHELKLQKKDNDTERKLQNRRLLKLERKLSRA